MPKRISRQFEALIEPHLNGLFRTAFRLSRNGADAEDLVQDTCLTACENLDALTSAEHPDRWLLRVLFNRFIDRKRRRDRSPVVPLFDFVEPLPLPSGEAGPEELCQRGEDERAFSVAFSRLDRTQQMLLSLRAEGYGLAEIEEITGIGKSVLRARLHRARQRLAQLLGPVRASDVTDINEPCSDGTLSRLGSKQ